MISVFTDRLARSGTFAVDKPAGARLLIIYDRGNHLELQFSEPPRSLGHRLLCWFRGVYTERETVWGCFGPAHESIRRQGARFVNRAAGLNWYVRTNSRSRIG